MLVNAMEIGGIKGTFKVSCESTMRVLRDNKESVLALLEAFVHDPLISWRLLTDEINPTGAELKAPDASEFEYEAMANTVSGKDQNQQHGQHVNETNLKENILDGIDENGQRLTNGVNINAAVAAAVGDVRNKRALEVVRRIQNKLNGRDFNPNVSLSVPEQIQRLVHEATSLENLCVAFIGWCSFW